MKILQIMPTISFGDAVSNDARAIDGILRESGHETGIFAENIDPRLPEGTACRMEALPKIDRKDLIIYHGSTGTELNFRLPSLGGKQMMVYHNITPPEFFADYSPQAERLTKAGYDGMKFLADRLHYCVADSDYNRQELIRMGYRCPIDVCPILIPFEDYDREPDQKVIDRYRGDGRTNLLFVGRVAPNKKQEDVIRAFAAYRQLFNPDARLFLVGSASGMENYEQRLKTYAEEMGVGEDVIFPGHIRFSEILAYYHLADVFLCMSEHEGFCVPLVEAMHFGVPIVAYASSAIPETLGEGGLLLDSKDPALAAAALNRVVQDQALRAWLKERQRVQLESFSYGRVRARWEQCLERFMKS